MTYVSQSVADTYQVVGVGGHDSARIFLKEGERADRQRYGYVSFVSSFGNRGHYFSNYGSDGRPFADFLVGCDWSYLANKFWGAETDLFDFDESVKSLKKLVRERRMHRAITGDEYRRCAEGLNQIAHTRSSDAFAVQVMATKIYDLVDLANDWSSATYKNPQCEGFRTVIWEPWCKSIRESSFVAATGS